MADIHEYWSKIPCLPIILINFQGLNLIIHPKRGIFVDKNVHENSPKVSLRIHQFCPWKFAIYVHKNSATLKLHATFINRGYKIKLTRSWSNMQCWTVGAIFTFGRSRMFGPDKLQPSAVGRSRSHRIKKPVKHKA